MMDMKWQSVIAGCAVLVALLFIVAEVEARRGGGGRGGGRGGGKSFSRSGPASHGSVRGHQSSSRNRSSNRSDMRDNRSERRDDRRDYKAERRDDRRDYRDDVRDDRRDYWDRRYRRRVGVSLTLGVFNSLSCASTTIYVNGFTYYRCGYDWYTRAYTGGNVTYIVVTAPAGH